MRKKTDPTIYDVAREAGVSTATVSRLINDVGVIRSETRQRVLKAIHDLGYIPKLRAGKDVSEPIPATASRPPIAFLKTGEFGDRHQSPVTTKFIEEVRRKAENLGLSFQVIEVPELTGTTPMRSLIGDDIQGVILRSSNIHEVSTEAVAWLDGLPAVQVLGENSGGRLLLDHLTPDNLQVGVMAADYLLGLGCERLVFMANFSLNKVAYERLSAFVFMAKQAGKEVDVYFQVSPDYQEELDHKLLGLQANCVLETRRPELIRRLASDQKGRSFGLFVPSDMLLSQLISQCEVLGLDIGKDIPAIGCNGEFRCFHGMMSPPATLDLRITDLAEQSLRRLLYRINHRSDPLMRLSIAPDLKLPEEVAEWNRSRSAYEIQSSPVRIL